MARPNRIERLASLRKSTVLGKLIVLLIEVHRPAVMVRGCCPHQHIVGVRIQIGAVSILSGAIPGNPFQSVAMVN